MGGKPRINRLRIVTLNLWGLREPLRARLRLAIDQLRSLQLDVVLLQEVRPLAVGRQTTAHVIADALGMSVHYHQVNATPTAADGWGPEGLAILSRGRLEEITTTELPGSTESEKRGLLSGRLLHGETMVWLHCTHLHHLVDGGMMREQQVVAIDAVSRRLLGQCTQPALAVIGGDFNAEPEADEVRFLVGQTTLSERRAFYQDAWARCSLGDDRGFTWSTETGAARTRRSVDVNRRLDYLFVSPRERSGRGTVRSARVVLGNRDARGVAASDHFGVFAEIQL